MKIPGKLVIVGMLALALAAALFAVWYRYSTVRHAQKFWGTTTAMLIAEAPQVRLFRLGASLEDGEPPPASDDEQIPAVVEFDGRSWPVLEVKDAADIKGLSQLRYALTQDSTFDWTAGEDYEDPEFQYALEFSDGHDWATVLFDLDLYRAALSAGNRTALLQPAAGKAIESFLDEQMGQPAPANEEPQMADDSPGEDKAAEPNEAAEKPPGDQQDKPADAPEAPAEPAKPLQAEARY